MQKNNAKEKTSWNDLEKCIASEIISGIKKESKAKDIGIICVTALSALIIAGLIFMNIENSRRFTSYLNSNYSITCVLEKEEVK